MKSSPLKKMQSREAVVGIAGPGHVGLPHSLRFAEVGEDA